jgi:hypothetical protein
MSRSIEADDIGGGAAAGASGGAAATADRAAVLTGGGRRDAPEHAHASTIVESDPIRTEPHRGASRGSGLPSVAEELRMAGTTPDSKLPALVAFAFVGIGLVIGLAMGLTHGSLAGGIIAAAGAIPACVGMWKGIQQQTQTTLALSIGALLCALGVGGLLIAIRIIDAIRN